MTASPAETVDQLLLEHLDKANLPEAVVDLILAAMCGEDELAATIGGAPSRRPAPETAAATAEPIGTYLASIEVTGFRGIGRTAELKLEPGPGLTVVTGRNGSGKSSFAEAAEFALTGDNKRWSGRGASWQDGWRNLHSPAEPRIRVRLGIEGHRNGAVVECRWPHGGKLAGHKISLQLAGQPSRSVAELGWATPLELYRPFLSYSELGGLLGGKPTEMHDSLHRILGLGRLVEIEGLLKSTRKRLEDQRKHAADTRPELMAALAAHPDPRARRAEAALAGKLADLDELATLATVDDDVEDTNVVPLRQLDLLELPSPAEVANDVERLRNALHQIVELAATPVAEARAVARLLAEALRHQRAHPDQPCPICVGRILDAAWAAEAERELHRLTERAQQLDDAHQAVRDATRTLRERIPALPAALAQDLPAETVPLGDLRIAWQHWHELVGSDDPQKIVESALGTFETLRAAFEPAQAAARQALDRRQRDWRPVADQIRAWVDAERAARRAASLLGAVRKAISWLLDTGAQIRNDKLAPIAAEATAIWDTLRQESNVRLGDIRLVGTGNTRRVDLRVDVDGVPGAALGVMSQGELHSLALALFLPRATMPESPFRFLVIDDPVQSMDPAKVYGLAQVLAEVARHRQVIVFTHDDRLPAAVRHLQLKAEILLVSRLARSQVIVNTDRDGNPALRYLSDARGIAQDDDIDRAVRVPVVCNLVRDAIEYACHDLIRRRAFSIGARIADTEAKIEAVRGGLSQTLTLALLDDAKRVGELPAALDRLHPAARRVVRAANSGTHGGDPGGLIGLIEDARRIVQKLAAS